MMKAAGEQFGNCSYWQCSLHYHLRGQLKKKCKAGSILPQPDHNQTSTRSEIITMGQTYPVGDPGVLLQQTCRHKVYIYIYTNKINLQLEQKHARQL
jgi:hypothetical protein